MSLEGFKLNAYDELKKAVRAAGLLVQNDMRKSILKGPKTGRVYKHGKNGTHRASAPGEAPANRSGRLASHINIEAIGLKATIGIQDATNVVYGARLEYGGRDSRGVHIEPRPYLQPALEKNKKEIEKRIRSAINAAGKKARK